MNVNSRSTSRPGALQGWALPEGGTFGACKSTTEVTARGAHVLISPVAIKRGSLQHFPFSRIKLPLGALSLAHACLGSSLPREPCREAWCPPSPVPVGQEAGLEASGGTILVAGVWAGWQRAFSGKTQPLAHPAGFYQLVPFARAQLITPKSGAKTTSDHSSHLQLPPLSLVMSWSTESG